MRYELSFRAHNPLESHPAKHTSRALVLACTADLHPMQKWSWHIHLMYSQAQKKKRKHKKKQSDLHPVKISSALMFVDEGDVWKTAEAALPLTSCGKRQRQDVEQRRRRGGTKGDRLKVIKGWQMTSPLGIYQVLSTYTRGQTYMQYVSSGLSQWQRGGGGGGGPGAIKRLDGGAADSRRAISRDVPPPCRWRGLSPRKNALRNQPHRLYAETHSK